MDPIGMAKAWAKAQMAKGTTGDILEAATVAQSRIKFALDAGTFIQDKNSDEYNNLIRANEYLGRIVSTLNKGEKIYKNVKLFTELYRALEVLDDPDIMTKNPKKAAAAFDTVFGVFGELLKQLPFPASYYGELLAACQTYSFFSNMEQVMAGPNSNLGRAMFLRDNIDRT